MNDNNELYKKYKSDFDSAIEKIDSILNFESVYESETSYKFKKRQGCCPYCGSGTHGHGSTPAFTFYPSLNIGKCYSCGTSTGSVSLIMYLHNCSYVEAVHYISREYFRTELTNPYEKINQNFKPKAKIEFSERKRISDAELKEEEQEKQKKFEYIKGLILNHEDKTEALNYLLSRGLVEEKLPEQCFYQAAPYQNLPAGVVFFDTEMRCLNKRYVTNQLPNGIAKSFTFGQMLNSLYDKTFRPEHDTIFITEGVINALSLYQAGKSSIALFATTNFINDNQKFKPYFHEKHVVIAFDADKAGIQSGFRQSDYISKNFNILSIAFVLLPNHVDCNDLLKSNELDGLLENPFNYAYLDEKRIKSELEKIEADRKNYIPDLRPQNYYTRPAADEEQEGTFNPVKEEHVPEKVFVQIQGTGELHEQMLKKFGITFLKEYTIIKNRKAHVHQSTEEKPLFLINDSKFEAIWRPKASKPFTEFEFIKKQTESPIFGLSTIEKIYEGNKLEEGRNDPALERISIAYNMVDFLNLAAIDEYPVLPLGGKIGYDDFEMLNGFTKEIYQIPTTDRNDLLKARNIGLKHIDIRTMYVPQLNGSVIPSVTDFLRHFPDTRIYKKRLATALPFKFWEYEKGDYDINIIKLRNFLSANGYYTYHNLQEKQGYMYIKIEGRIVKRMDLVTFERHIETFVDHYLEKRGENVKLRNKVSISSRFSESNLSGLKEIKLDFENSGKNFQNWFFKDGNMWTVTVSGIKRQSQNNLQKYVWEDELLDYPSDILKPAFRIFYQPDYKKQIEELELLEKGSKEYMRKKMEIGSLKPSQIYDIEILDKDNYFLQFLFLTSFAYYEEVERAGIDIKKDDFWYKCDGILTPDQIMECKIHLINKLTWLGYIMKDYKSMADDYGLAILDAIDHEDGLKRKGAAGGGKSIICKAIKQVKRTLIMKAEAEDWCENKHRYENYDGEKVIVADDMHLKSRIGNMLTDFSEGIEVNPKHKRPRKIPFLDSPKIIITRNYIDDEGERVDRRIGRMFVFPFFHDKKSGRHKISRRPNEYFGRMLFQDDGPEDKSRLINLMANCYQVNLKYGEINPPMGDMEKYRMANRIGEPLIEFLDTYFESGENFGYIDRVPFFDRFKEQYTKSMSPYQRTTLYSSSQKFKGLVEQYCDLRGYLFNPENVLTDKVNKRVMKLSETQKNKHGYAISTEHFYISLKDGIIPEQKTVEQEVFGDAKTEMPF